MFADPLIVRFMANTEERTGVSALPSVAVDSRIINRNPNLFLIVKTARSNHAKPSMPEFPSCTTNQPLNGQSLNGATRAWNNLGQHCSFAAFNPSLPVDGSLIIAGELRDQFNGVVGMIESIPAGPGPQGHRDRRGCRDNLLQRLSLTG